MTKHLFISAPELLIDWKMEHKKSMKKNNTIWRFYLGLHAKNNASVYGSFEYPGNANSECLSW